MAARDPAFETQTVERKKSLNERDEGLESLCGMVNAVSARGSVEFGIAPDGTVVGLTGNLDTAQQTLVQAMKSGFQPQGLPYEIHLQAREGAQIIVVSAVRANATPYYEFKGRAFVREGPTTRQLTWEEKMARLKAGVPDSVVSPAPAAIEVVFDASHHDVLGLGTRQRRSIYRFGVRGRALARLSNVRAAVADIRGLDEEGRPPLVWVARPVPSTLRFWNDDRTFSGSRSGVAVEAGATEYFGLVYWLLDTHQLHLDSLEDSGVDYSPIPTHRRLRIDVRVTASNAVAVIATFDVWVDGDQLHCERLPDSGTSAQLGSGDFRYAPLLRWQSPGVEVLDDLGLKVDVLCTNEGSLQAIARVQRCEATLVGWGPLLFEEFGPGTSVYPVLGDARRRFTLKIRSGARGAIALGHSTIRWSVVYTDNLMRRYLTIASVDCDVQGKGAAPIVEQALDETDASTRYERYERLLREKPDSGLIFRST